MSSITCHFYYSKAWNQICILCIYPLNICDRRVFKFVLHNFYIQICLGLRYNHQCIQGNLNPWHAYYFCFISISNIFFYLDHYHNPYIYFWQNLNNSPSCKGYITDNFDCSPSIVYLCNQYKLPNQVIDLLHIDGLL